MVADLIKTLPLVHGLYLPVKEVRITAGADQQRGSVRHGAVDIGVPVGTPVYAIADSEVVKAKMVHDSSGTCGSQVALKFKHPDSPTGYSFVNYCHLSEVNPKLEEGMWIKGGTQIGLSGGQPGAPGAGNTTGPHLHMSVRLGDEYFTSNSYASDPAVYDTLFDNARVPPRRFYKSGGFKVVFGLLMFGGLVGGTYYYYYYYKPLPKSQRPQLLASIKRLLPFQRG